MRSTSDGDPLAQISRALRNGWNDQAFVLVRELTGSGAVAAAFLLESGVTVDELPLGAKRAIVESRSEAA